MASNYLLAGMILQVGGHYIGGGGGGGHHFGGGGGGVFLLSVQHGGEYTSTVFGYI